MGIRVEIHWEVARGDLWTIKIYSGDDLLRHDRLSSPATDIDDTDPDLSDEELIYAAREQQRWYGIEFSANVITVIRQ
jgi:hypothetical protein